jgi:hypothetical protein
MPQNEVCTKSGLWSFKAMFVGDENRFITPVSLCDAKKPSFYALSIYLLSTVYSLRVAPPSILFFSILDL